MILYVLWNLSVGECGLERKKGDHNYCVFREGEECFSVFRSLFEGSEIRMRSVFMRKVINLLSYTQFILLVFEYQLNRTNCFKGSFEVV